MDPEDWQITAYVFGQLEGDELKSFEQRLGREPELQRAVEQTRVVAEEIEADAELAEAATESMVGPLRMRLTGAFAAPDAARDAGGPSPVPAQKIPVAHEPVDVPSRNRRWLAALAALAAAGLVAVTWGARPWTVEVSQQDVLPAPTDAPSEEGRTPAENRPMAPVESRPMAPADTAPAPTSSPEEARGLGTYTQAPSDPYSAAAGAGVTGGMEGKLAEGDPRYAAPVDPTMAAGPGGYGGASRTRGESAAPGGDPLGYGGGYGSGYGGGYGAGYGPVDGTYSSGAYGASAGSGQGKTRLAANDSESDPGSAGGHPMERSTERPSRRRSSYGLNPTEGLDLLADAPRAPAAGEPLAAGAQAAPAAPAIAPVERGEFGRWGEDPRVAEVPEREWSFRYRGMHQPYLLSPNTRLPRSGDAYAAITENSFQSVSEHPLSTFSIDVDTASYSKVRALLQQHGTWPDRDAVRIEEMVNYFDYQYAQPEGDVPFAAAMEVATCPWNPRNRLARVAIRGRSVENEERTVSNLVFLLDVSGSMSEPNKLPLVRRGLEMLVRQLGENDRVAIVVYAGAAGLVLDSTTADQQETILAAIDRLQAGGSTNGGQGIQLAYQTARDHFIPGGTNRVILCTDGDFNVGVTGTEHLVEMVEQEARGGIFLSVLGFGTGNLNDAMLEAISGRGDGNYAFIDSDAEARKVLVEQLAGTLVAIAKDVKIQVEFNPANVDSYRLIGYENRLMPAEDFEDDTKDAGEIGAGHTVTALYEIVPAGTSHEGLANLRYQPRVEQPVADVPAEYRDELLVLKVRYKAPEGGEGRTLEFPIPKSDVAFEEASEDFRFAAAVAGFGMLLRGSPHAGDATLESVRQIARGAIGEDPRGLRAEFVGLVDAARRLSPRGR